MQDILIEVLSNYLNEKQSLFSGNELAKKLRQSFPKSIASIISDKNRFKVVGSPGLGQWTECPWIAIFDILITDSAQSGYYPVFLFKTDMSGVYLSLNQGVASVKDYYKKDAKKVLQLRAQDYRAKIDFETDDILDINLNAKGDAKFYEYGNIIARYYPLENIPDDQIIVADIIRYLNLYEELAFNDVESHEVRDLTAIEKKQYRFHLRIERNSEISNKVKKTKGYICEACEFDFKSKYGELGERFIEAHHVKPISSLSTGKFKVNLVTDFIVLCSNCHSMIHRLEDPSDIEKLKSIIKNRVAANQTKK